MSEVLMLYRRSQLESADCLHRYNAIWRHGVDDSSDYSLRGIGFHVIKHQYIRLLLEQNLRADEETAWLAFTVGIAKAKTPDRLIPEIKGIWERHIPHFELDLDRYVTSEEKQDVGGMVFTPDLVYANPDINELEIVDDKTYFVALTEDQLRTEFQPRFYIRHAMARWPHFRVYRFTAKFVRLGVITSITFDESELEALDREVLAATAKITQAEQDEQAGVANPWPATAGPACQYCQLACPIADQPMALPKRIDNAQQAQYIASGLTVAENMVRAARKLLKGYVTVHGPLNVAGLIWDHTPILERKYPVDTLVKLLAARGVMGAFEASAEEDALTISHTALKKLFKRFPDLEQELASTRMEKTTYRFGAKKATGSPLALEEETVDG